ncbi:DUF2272 domain-containing protein [Mitsuaria sp. GD03876]|uniref:DUF2272 domain-containing protein n=1 Tax=Mitsuaria sp. GD03876 TaxID=2975399 RepID=UPI00244B8475|nr:DUF2272 domain-containing protein [Mitsuaria sp. GD03876]MDH0865763.1 DUF2272 domain-containing protein [Mitsuaria sp. GD03876]
MKPALLLLCVASPLMAAPDLDQLKTACTHAAGAPASPLAQGLASFAEAEWVRFGRGKITEAADDDLVAETPTSHLLSWDKVYQYWVATNSVSVLSYPYAVQQGTPPAKRMANAQNEIAAVSAAFVGDPDRLARIVASLRRSAINSTAWSAVFISTMFKINGLDANEFEGSPSHAMYMRSAIDHVGRPDTTYRQLPCDPGWIKPRVGDLVCYSRTPRVRSFADVMSRYDGDRGLYPFDSHCDVVSKVSPDGKTLESVGGNVGNSVTRTRRKTATGKIDESRTESGSSNDWVMVLVLTR